MTDWQPRFLRAGEEPALLQLLLDAYGTWPKFEISVTPLDHLLWKLEAGIEPYRASVVEDRGAIIGAVLISFRDLHVNGRTVRGTSGSDVAVHTAYQDKHVFTAMTPLLWDLNMATAGMSYGYKSRNLAVQRANRPYERSRFGNFVNVLVAPTTQVAPAATVAEPWHVHHVEAFDERVDVLWRDAAPQFGFIADRRHGFLNWRFADRRAGGCTCIVAEQDGRILGYAVARVSNGRGYLVDLLALPNRPDVVLSLARQALDVLRRAGADEGECWLPSRHTYFDVLAEAGFTTVKTTQDITYHELQICARELAFLQEPKTSVHFTLGDTDLV